MPIDPRDATFAQLNHVAVGDKNMTPTGSPWRTSPHEASEEKQVKMHDPHAKTHAKNEKLFVDCAHDDCEHHMMSQIANALNNVQPTKTKLNDHMTWMVENGDKLPPLHTHTHKFVVNKQTPKDSHASGGRGRARHGRSRSHSRGRRHSRKRERCRSRSSGSVGSTESDPPCFKRKPRPRSVIHVPVHAALHNVLAHDDESNNMRAHIATQCVTLEPQPQPQPQPQPPLNTATVSLCMMNTHKCVQHINKHSTVLDTGATRTMTPCIAFFIKKLQHKPNTPIRLGDGSLGPMAHGAGAAKMPDVDIVINNVIYVPNLPRTCLAWSDMDRMGCSMTCHKRIAIVRNNAQKIVAVAARIRANGLHFAIDKKTFDANMHVLSKMSYDLLHRRLGHLGQDAIRKTVSAVDGIDPHITSRKNHKCPTCLLANSRRRPFSRKIKLSHRPHTLNQVTYSDLKTGLRISFRGYTMFVVHVESASRHVTVGLMRNKMQTTESYIKYVQFAENVTSEQMMTLRTDGGTEYKGQLAAHNAARGIQHETAPPYSQSMNGPAERAIGVLLQLTRALLHQARMPSSHWCQKVTSATKTADYLIFTDGSSLEDLRIGSGIVMHDNGRQRPQTHTQSIHSRKGTRLLL